MSETSRAGKVSLPPAGPNPEQGLGPMPEAAAENTRHPTAKEMALTKRYLDRTRLKAPHGYRLSRSPHKPASLIDAFDELRMMSEIIRAGFGVDGGLNEREAAAFSLLCSNLGLAIADLSTHVRTVLEGLSRDLEEGEARDGATQTEEEIARLKMELREAGVRAAAYEAACKHYDIPSPPDLSEPIPLSDTGAALAG